MSSSSSSSSSKVWWLHRYRLRLQIVFVALLSIILGLLYTSNPLLYTDYHTNTATTSTIDKKQFNTNYYHIQQNDQIDIIFDLYQSYFPTTTTSTSDDNTNELLAYKNHCLRALSLSVYYYISQNTDTSDSNESSDQHLIDLAAIALAYHDLALWVTIQEQSSSSSSSSSDTTASDTTTTSTKTKQPIGTLDYLNPSVELFLYDQEMLRTTATTDVDENQSVQATPSIKLVSEYESYMIVEMIQQHHKFTTWKYSTNNTTTAIYNQFEIQQMELLVNAIRCSDWMDATMGIIVPWGCNNNHQNNNTNRIVTTTRIDYLNYLYYHLLPYQFHQMLILFLSKLSPSSYIGRLHILRILKW